MTDKIAADKPLVVLHGDEMAQIAFDRILEQFVHKYLDIPLIEIDLSAEKRLLTDGQVVVDAIAALKQYGVGIKNAGMTVNRDQLDELLAKHSHIKEDELDRLATRSPNGAIRKGIGGNITREDIHFRNIEVKRPGWWAAILMFLPWTVVAFRTAITSYPRQPVSPSWCLWAAAATRLSYTVAFSIRATHGLLPPTT